ncbi:DNA-methyltransferase [Schlesneria paludicola]|uniref:DNA-methyltransferase n=1 Tax=Schlesneria paludicola TaxID=360056 RepID=UPI00029B1BB3|nr:DNA methyltransferase [Schlesneria paludicola]
MKPYYERAGIALYHGDCHEVFPVLEPGKFSVMLTDPPYCSGAATSSAKTADPVAKYCQNGDAKGRPTFSGDAKDQRSFVAWSVFWMSACRRLLKDGGYGLVFTDWRQLPSVTDAFQAADFTWRGLIAWDKGLSSRSPHKGYARHQCEYLVWGTNGKCRPRADAGPFPGCHHESVRQADKFHIVGKPTELMVKLVEFCPVGESLIDCFAGSGTTLVAAAKSGRYGVGIEREEANCEIAARRLDRFFESPERQEN